MSNKRKFLDSIASFIYFEFMGSCCSGHVKYGAFRHELGVPLIDDVKSKLNLDTKVVVVRLAALKDIPVGNSYSGSTDAFVELRLLPDDPIVGNQKQLSSVRPQSISPKWVTVLNLVMFSNFSLLPSQGG